MLQVSVELADPVTVDSSTRLDTLMMVLLNKIVWDMMVCSWVCGSEQLKGS
jgi:hypothetical protein